MSILKCSPTHDTPMLPLSRPASVIQCLPPVPGGNVPRPACSLLATDPLTQLKPKPMRPAVRDKISTETAHEQSWVPYPNAASHSHVSSSSSPNLKMNVSKGLPANVIDKNQRRVTLCLPSTQTVPALSSPLPPASLIPLGSSLPLKEEETFAKMEERQPVKAAVSKNTTSVEQHSPSP